MQPEWYWETSFLQEPRETSYNLMPLLPCPDLEIKHIPTFFLFKSSDRIVPPAYKTLPDSILQFPSLTSEVSQI